MAKSIYKGDGIKWFTPQREPILMVDVLYRASDTMAVTGLTIAWNNLFVVDGSFTEPGLIEHAAQSMSVFSGYADFQAQRPQRTGFIGEIKGFTIYSLPRVGDRLITHVKYLSQAGNILLFSSETQVDGALIALSQMKVSYAQK